MHSRFVATDRRLPVRGRSGIQPRPRTGVCRIGASASAILKQFHSYSLGNQLLAWSQCLLRGIQPGPMATYPRWRELGRHVRRGEKAITLCMPVKVKRATEPAESGEGVNLKAVERFAKHFHRPSHQLNHTHLREYQAY